MNHLSDSSHFFTEQFLEAGTIISLEKGKVLVGAGPREWKSYHELDAQRPAFYYPDFFLSETTAWFQHPACQEWAISEVLFDHAQIAPLQWSDPDRSLFQQMFGELSDLFSVGALKKAVPYAFTHSTSTMAPLQLKRSLISALNAIQSLPGYLYGFWDRHEGILGVTPEMLFECVGHRQLKTMALAGTASKLVDIDVFLNDAKQRAEHQFVVDGIKLSLQPYGEVLLGSLQVLQLAHLNHLLTPIQLEIKQQLLFDTYVKALHPTPALGAFPRGAGSRWLSACQDKLPRKRYGAPVGVLNGGKMLSLVGIRNVQWDKHGMHIGAGCGVVKDSQEEQEWQEILLKISAIKGLLAL